MKNLKELIKPGYIVDIADSELEEYRYIVVDAQNGLCFHNIYETEMCEDLNNFDINLINASSTECNMITGIYRLNNVNGSTDWDSDLVPIWKREIVKVSIEEIAKKFNTTPENLKINGY